MHMEKDSTKIFLSQSDRNEKTWMPQPTTVNTLSVTQTNNAVQV